MNNEFARLVGDYLKSEDGRVDRRTLAQRLIVAIGGVCLLVLILIAATWPTKAHAEPVMQTSEGGVTVQLWTDACALQKQISNLPYKATWHENGKVIEGCWGARPDAGVVIFYFADKTVGMAPIQAFVKVVGV